MSLSDCYILSVELDRRAAILYLWLAVADPGTSREPTEWHPAQSGDIDAAAFGCGVSCAAVAAITTPALAPTTSSTQRARMIKCSFMRSFTSVVVIVCR